MAAPDPRLLLLDPRDNVLVVRSRLAAGDVVETGEGSGRLDRDVPLAHKLARRAIADGETILKYGAPIGVATESIAAGAHVHVHNMKSAYTPTYHLEDERAAAPSPPAGEGGSAQSAETDEGSLDGPHEPSIGEGGATPHPALRATFSRKGRREAESTP